MKMKNSINFFLIAICLVLSLAATGCDSPEDKTTSDKKAVTSQDINDSQHPPDSTPGFRDNESPQFSSETQRFDTHYRQGMDFVAKGEHINAIPCFTRALNLVGKKTKKKQLCLYQRGLASFRAGLPGVPSGP